MPGSFFDTNVLIYLASGDRRRRIGQRGHRRGGTISVQVLNELTNVARRKMRLSWEETRMFLSTFVACCRSIRSPWRCTRPGWGSLSATVFPPMTR